MAFEDFNGDFGPPPYDGGDLGDGSGYAGLAAVAAPLRPPPPKRLTIEDILGMQADAPTKPVPITSLGDLQGGDRTRAQQNSLWAGLAALGSGISNNFRGEGAAGGVGQVQAAQQQVIDSTNARNTAQYTADAADAAAKQEDQQKQAAAAGVMGMYSKIADSEPPDSPFLAQATAAARAGSMSELEKMATQEPMRVAARAQGKDPDAWDTNQRLQAELKDALEAQNIRTLSGPKSDAAVAQEQALAGPKLAAAVAEAKARQDALMPGEKALKLAPSYQQPQQYEPLDRVAARTELVQGIEDKHLALRAAAKQGTSIPGRLGQSPDGTWGWLSPPTAAGQPPSFTPIDGQPKKGGGLSHFQKDGVPYVWNPAKPELGAIEVQTHAAGEVGAPSFKDLQPPPAPARPASAVVAPRPVVAPPPANPTQKLSALMADPVMAAKVKLARQKGISDAAIAAHLGL